MPVQLGWAFEAGRQGRLPQGRALAFAGEDDGARVAMTLEMRGGPA
jgi:3-oxoacyl-[acyl-carrier-protein] synthase-1